jgi:hypothetical protein
MRSRVRAAFLAAVAWLREASNKRPDNPQCHRDGSNNKEASADHSKQPATGMLHAEWAALQALIREIHRSEEQHQRAERELGAAQLRTAKGLNRITVIGAILSFLGFLGIVGSIIIAKRASDDARITAYAARDQAGAAQIQASVALDEQRRSHRPWIDLLKVEIDESLAFTDHAATLSIKATLKNVGTSPAIDTTVENKLYVRPWPEGYIGKIIDQYICESHPVPSSGMLFSQIIMPGDIATVSEVSKGFTDDMEPGKNGWTLPWCSVCVRYHDEFGIQHGIGQIFTYVPSVPRPINMPPPPGIIEGTLRPYTGKITFLWRNGVRGPED